jgi:hypothetical protein
MSKVDIKVGDIVVVQGKRYSLYLATVTNLWLEKMTYGPDPEEKQPAVLEVEYDTLFGKRRKLIKACYVEAVTRPVPQP